MRSVGAALALAVAACGSAAEPAPDPFAAPAACSSGATRDVNESEGPEMMPGRACNACHEDVNASTGEAAPIFRFAGTLYPSGHEPDDCVGSDAEGAEVLVTDTAGATLSAVANRSGNFMLEAEQPFVPPFSVRVRLAGRERRMLSLQRDGDCNGCHTRDGAMGAPGRIVLP
ncbi:MAG TPA: hypothetical protein VIF57_07810 [Polyangia bacterium]|jgi:hypothetical protein